MSQQIPVVQAYLVQDYGGPDPAPAPAAQQRPSQGAIARTAGAAPLSAESAAQLNTLLNKHNWPVGLKRLLIDNIHLYQKRYFILDDSGSMMTNDGQKVVGQGNKQKFSPCSRWSELTAAIRFHAELATIIPTSTEFRFLNNGGPINFGNGCDNSSSYHTLLTHLETSPTKKTPLVRHINEITAEILLIVPELRATGRKAVLIIASDGEASDGDVAAALAPLQHLPVWIVIRLCTDEKNVREYWNSVDNDLELDMDVLDDIQAEAEEIFEFNPWLTYGEPIHKLREWGVSLKEIDLLDESLLSVDQMKAVCIKFFSKEPNVFIHDIPEPGVSWKEFSAWIVSLTREDANIWSPKFERTSPWIDMRMLKVKYDVGGSSSAACVMM